MKPAFIVIVLMALLFPQRISAQCTVSTLADTSQTICVGSSITQINFYTSNFTTAVATGLPGDLPFAFRTDQQSGLGVITGTPLTVGIYKYTVTFTANGCFRQITGTISVVNAVNVSIVGDSDQVICNGFGSTTEINFSGPAGTLCRWTNDNPAIGLPAKGTNKIPSFQVQNNTDNLINAKIAVRPSLPTKKSVFFSYTNALQSWTIPPNTISVKITAIGGRGGNVSLINAQNQPVQKSGGYGALTSATFNVGPGEKLRVGDNLQILVGGKGGDLSNPLSGTGGGGGGGGSFVAVGTGSTTFETELLVSAGGGGAGTYSALFGGEDGADGGHSLQNNLAFGSGGLNLGNLVDGAAGAGVSENGGSQNTPCRATGGTAIKNGGLGGIPDCFWGGGAGGYGGGGGGGLTGGGGGGFSGGNSYTAFTAASGGSSYIDSARTDSLNLPGFNSIDGFVHIEYLLQTCTGTDKIIKISVPPVARMKPTTDRIFCSGTNINPIPFSTLTKGNSIVFSWIRKGPNIGIPASGTGIDLRGTVTNNSTTELIDTIIVSAGFVVGSDTCYGTPDSFTITVNPVVEPEPLTSQYLCFFDDSQPIIFSSKTNDGVINYTWVRTDSGQFHSTGNGDIASFRVQTVGSSVHAIVYAVTPRYINTRGGPGCNGKVATDTIFLIPSVAISPISDQYKCQGGQSDPILIDIPTPDPDWSFTYEWWNDNIEIGLDQSHHNTQIISPFTTTNNKNEVIYGTIVVIPTLTYRGKQCQGRVGIYTTINVLPEAKLNPVSDTAFCNNYTTNPIYFTTQGNLPATAVDYKWKSVNQTIPGLDSSTFSIPSFTTSNTGAEPIQDSIIVIPTLYNLGIVCVGRPDTFKITVNPTVKLAIQDMKYCDSQFTNQIIFNSSTQKGNKIYTWANDNTAIGLPYVGYDFIQSFLTHNNYDSAITANLFVFTTYENGGATCDGEMDTFQIKVNHRVKLNPVADHTWCNGQMSDSILLESPPQAAGTVDYTWVNPDPTNGLGPTDTGLVIPSFYTVNPHSIATSTYIDVTPNYLIDGISCPGTTSQIKLTINPIAHVSRLSDVTVCYGLKTIPIIFNSPTGTIPGSFISYTWMNFDTSIGLQFMDGGNIPSFTAANPADSPLTTRIVVTPAYFDATNICTGVADTFQITVNPEPRIDLVLSQIKCNGANSDSINFSSASIKGGTLRYEWENNTVSIGLPAIGTGNINPFEVFNGGRLPVTGIIKATPYYLRDSLTCPGKPGSFTITVNPTPHIDSLQNFTDSVFCNGESVDSIGFVGDIDGSVFRWACSVGIGIPLNGVGYNIPSFLAVNPFPDQIVSDITISVVANGCIGPDTTITIIVNPSPPTPEFRSKSLYSTTEELTVCRGTNNINFNILAPDSTVSYTWSWASEDSTGNVTIHSKTTPNTSISFPESGVYLVSAIAETGAGCSDILTQQVLVSTSEGINERRILQKQPGDLLFYPDNSMDRDSGYKWGYDSLISEIPQRQYSAPAFIPAQSLQVFTPSKRFLDASENLDTVNYAFWVLLRKAGCESRVYYNGPYAAGRFAPQTPEDKSVRMKVLPNPNNGHFDLSLEGNIYGEIEVTIYNPVGQSVHKEHFIKKFPSVLRQMDAGDLPNGLYFIELRSSDLKHAEIRFMIQR